MWRGVHGANMDTDLDTVRVIGCCIGDDDLDLMELNSSRDFDERRELATYGCGMCPIVVACKYTTLCWLDSPSVPELSKNRSLFTSKLKRIWAMKQYIRWEEWICGKLF